MEMLNWTDIIVGVIGVVISICVSLITKQAIPWLKSKNLYEAAVVAVEAAEAIYGRYKGEDKLKAALATMAARGFDVESDRVIEAVQAAWKNLDTAMHASGEKELLGVNG